MVVDVVEICCGMGGARKAFVDSGFNVIQSIDVDKTVCDFHKEFWGDVEKHDINECDFKKVKSANVLSAGFPCQPFSSSGYRTGFEHQQGNVFTALMQLADEKKFDAIFLENVQGLLSNDKNRTFKLILSQLARRYTRVEWITFNLLSLGIPMNRPRVVIVAHNFGNEVLSELRDKFYEFPSLNLFSESENWIKENFSQRYDINQLTGVITNGEYQVQSYELKKTNFNGNLMNFIFKRNIGEFLIHSGRFWGRTGKTTFYISENQFSHSIGTSMGGAPTFGFAPEHLTDEVLLSVKEVSNYQTEHSGYFVFRTKPEETLKFFGPRAEVFHSALKNFKAPLATKYKLIGNMFAPDQAFMVTDALGSMGFGKI